MDKETIYTNKDGVSFTVESEPKSFNPENEDSSIDLVAFRLVNQNVSFYLELDEVDEFCDILQRKASDIEHGGKGLEPLHLTALDGEWCKHDTSKMHVVKTSDCVYCQLDTANELLDDWTKLDCEGFHKHILEKTINHLNGE